VINHAIKSFNQTQHIFFLSVICHGLLLHGTTQVTTNDCLSFCVCRFEDI